MNRHTRIRMTEFFRPAAFFRSSPAPGSLMTVCAALALAGCGNGSPADVRNCAIVTDSATGSHFVAEVLDRSEKPVARFSVIAATTGLIVIDNGDHIVRYDVSRTIAPQTWTPISIENRYRVRSFSACTVAHVTFSDGSYWNMPTPEF